GRGRRSEARDDAARSARRRRRSRRRRPAAARRARSRRRRARGRSRARVKDKAERCIYGAGPVREVLARRPTDLRSIWVDPRRADKSAGDQVAQIVTAARAAGIRVEDRDRATLDRAAGEGARHQGVIAWLGAFGYAELEDLAAEAPALLVALDG